jgi:hypothetical protein
MSALRELSGTFEAFALGQTLADLNGHDGLIFPKEATSLLGCSPYRRPKKSLVLIQTVLR